LAGELDELLEHYQRELLYLRRSGVEFARTYPKIAARLEIGPEGSADPHVERLIESFAYLAARVQRNIDAEFPKLVEALFSVLYPQLANPVPAMAIARFDIDTTKGQSAAGVTIERGTPVFAMAEDDLRCRFRTCFPITLWPIEVKAADILTTDRFDFLDHDHAASVLRVHFEASPETFAGLSGRRLRLFISGDPVSATSILELILTGADRVAFVPVGGDPVVKNLGEAVTPVGFEEADGVLPFPDNGHPAYRLLMEYFSFPEKFRFVDIEFPTLAEGTTNVDVLFLLTFQPRRGLPVRPDNFLLACTPIINLFSKVAEPLRLDHRRSEYRILADARLDRVTEVHSVTQVVGNTLTGDKRSEYRPYFSTDHFWDREAPEAFWFARRVPTERREAPGSDVYLSFVSLDLEAAQPADNTILIHCLCTNRQLAEQVPAGAVLQIELPAPVSRIICLTRPTTPHQPALSGETAWRLVSHLSLNYLSLSEGSESLRAFQEILRLYAPSLDPVAEQQINGIRAMRCERVTRRITQGGRAAICRGLGITLDFDERRFVGSSPFLLANVLERFFGLYASVNAFTQLTITSQQRSGIWYSWPARIGAKALV
jgi:type VI secretion system protein ImpG